MSTVVIRGHAGTGTTCSALGLAAAWRRYGGTCVGPVVVPRRGANEPPWACELVEVGSGARHPFVIMSTPSERSRMKRAAHGFHVVPDGLHHARHAAQQAAGPGRLLILDVLNANCDRAAMASAKVTKAIVDFGDVLAAWPGPAVVVAPIVEARYNRASWDAIMNQGRVQQADRLWAGNGGAEWAAIRCLQALVRHLQPAIV